MPTIVLASQKGGAGKTTAAIGLALTAARAGLSVGLIDGDPQQHAAMWLDLYAEANGVRLYGDTSEKEGMAEWSYGGITAARNVYEDAMVDRIQEYAARFDVVFVDTQGSANNATLMAIAQANLVIAPVQTSRFDVRGALTIRGLITQAGKMIGREIPFRFMLSRTKPGAVESRPLKAVRGQLTEAGIPLMKVQLQDRAAFQVLTIEGVPPDPESKNESEANAAANLQWLLREVVSIMKTQEAA